jgi:glycosyltransferase involved in cell wall biosynthesis
MGANISESELKRRFDVIIPTRNSARTIRASLAALRKSDVPVNRLIVVDGFSSDGTARIALEFGARVVQAEANYSQALRIGAKLATTTYVLILDSDVLIDPNFYGKLEPSIEDHFMTKGVFFHEMNWTNLSRWLFRVMWNRVRALEAAFVDREKFLQLTGDWEDGLLDAGADLVLIEVCLRRRIPIAQLPFVVNIHLTGHFSRLWRQEVWFGRSDRKSNRCHKSVPLLAFLQGLVIGIRPAIEYRDPRFIPFTIMQRFCYLWGWIKG